MRITAQAKQSTRQKILETARQMFCTAGYRVTRTRDIAKGAGIASGTLFNYFPTKEAVAAALVMELPSELDVTDRNFESWEEAIFAHAAQSLRHWKPCRRFVLPVLESTLSALGQPDPEDVGFVLRTAHLEAVQRLSRAFLPQRLLTALDLHMYWTLYFGVVTFWVDDPSPKQESTLALLDQSIGMFVNWMQSGPSSPKPLSGDSSEYEPWR
jgi:AcrR family transcriptional regulator